MGAASASTVSGVSPNCLRTQEIEGDEMFRELVVCATASSVISVAALCYIEWCVSLRVRVCVLSHSLDRVSVT